MSEVAARPNRASRRNRPALPWRLRLLIVAALLLTGAVAYGIVEAVSFNSSSAPTGTMMRSTGFFTPPSSKPVQFSLAPLAASGTGAQVTLPMLLGKPVVINMWASTCTVCTSETPAIESVAKQLGSRVNFVGVDSADTHAAALAFLHRYGVSYRQLFDPEAKVADGYGIPGLPVTVFMTAQGKVVGENIGALTASSLRHYLDVLFHV